MTLSESIDLFRSNEPTQHYGLSLQSGGFGVPDSPYGKRGSRRKPPHQNKTKRKALTVEAAPPLLTKGKHGQYVRVTFKSKRKIWAGMKKKGPFYRFFVLDREGAPKEIEKKGNIVQQELIIAAKADILKIEPAHMSRKYGQLEIIKKGRVNERFAGAKAERGTWYHGTDFKNYRSIRKQGLIPDPKVKAWAEDPQAGFQRASRVSHGGIYVTTNLLTATASSPSGPGKEALLVVMDLQPRSVWADEDSLVFWIDDIGVPGMAANDFSIAQLYSAWKVGARKEKAWAKKARDGYITAVMAALLKNVKTPHPGLKTRVQALLKVAWGASLTRKMAYVSDRTWKRSYSEYKPDVDWEDIPPKPDKSKVEKGYRKVVEQLTRTLKRLTLPSVVPDDINRTARVVTPINYKGKNRIVSLLKLWTDPDDYRTHVQVLFGKVPAQLVKDWNTRIGKWRPEEPGKLVASFIDPSFLSEAEAREPKPGHKFIYTSVGVPFRSKKAAEKRAAVLRPIKDAWVYELPYRKGAYVVVVDRWPSKRESVQTLAESFITYGRLARLADEAQKDEAPKATAKNTRLRVSNTADKKLGMTCAQCVYWDNATTQCSALAQKVKADQLCDLYARFIEKMTPRRMKKLIGYFDTPVGKLAVVGDPKKRYSLPVQEYVAGSDIRFTMDELRTLYKAKSKNYEIPFEAWVSRHYRVLPPETLDEAKKRPLPQVQLLGQHTQTKFGEVRVLWPNGDIKVYELDGMGYQKVKRFLDNRKPGSAANYAKKHGAEVASMDEAGPGDEPAHAIRIYACGHKTNCRCSGRAHPNGKPVIHYEHACPMCFQDEAEEPGGDDPADTSKAKALASQMRKHSSTALSFRQLWRHKYVEKNLDSSKAWKIFYWNMTHAGAGGKGFNPNTRVAAAKLMVSAFNKWAKAGMKAKVSRADGMKELPIGQISRAEFIKWYGGGGKTGTDEAVDTTLVSIDDTSPKMNAMFRREEATWRKKMLKFPAKPKKGLKFYVHWANGIGLADFTSKAAMLKWFDKTTAKEAGIADVVKIWHGTEDKKKIIQSESFRPAYGGVLLRDYLKGSRQSGGEREGRHFTMRELTAAANEGLDEARKKPMTTPREVALRKKDFDTATCDICRYYKKDGFCQVLNQNVEAKQVCDAYQGDEKKFKPYTVKDVDMQAFFRGMVKEQPYQHVVVRGINTPVGPLLIIRDTMKPKPHIFSLNVGFHKGHTSREHHWTQAEVNRLVTAGVKECLDESFDTRLVRPISVNSREDVSNAFALLFETQAVFEARARKEVPAVLPQLRNMRAALESAYASLRTGRNRDAVQHLANLREHMRAFKHKLRNLGHTVIESVDEIVNPADFREVNRYVMQVYNDIERDAPGTLLKLFKRKKPSRNIEYKPTTVRAGRENRNVHGISFIEQYRLVREKDGEIMVQEKTIEAVRSFAEDDQEMDWIIDANYDNDVARGYYRDEFGNRLTIERVDTVSTDEIFLAHGGPPRIIAPGSVPGRPGYGRTVFPGDEPPEPVRKKKRKKVTRADAARSDFKAMELNAQDEAIGPLNMAGQRRVTFKTDRGVKLKGTTVSIPGFKEFTFVLVSAHGSKAKATKVGWSVYEYSTGFPVWTNTLVPNQPELDKPEDAVNNATKRLRSAGKERISAGLAKMKTVNESLAGMFVEQEPPNGNGNGNEKPKPTTKDAKKAEKEDFDIDDIQLYYDMQVAGGENGKVAVRLTKKQFKIKTLTVNPAGRVMVQGLERPSPPAALPPAPAAPAGEPPPEAPPEEPPPPPEKRPPESLASAFIETRDGDERPPTRTVGGLVGGGPIPRTGGSLWPIRTSFRSQAKPLATAQSSVKKPHPGEPLYKAGAI